MTTLRGRKGLAGTAMANAMNPAKNKKALRRNHHAENLRQIRDQQAYNRDLKAYEAQKPAAEPFKMDRFKHVQSRVGISSNTRGGGNGSRRRGGNDENRYEDNQFYDDDGGDYYDDDVADDGYNDNAPRRRREQQQQQQPAKHSNFLRGKSKKTTVDSLAVAVRKSLAVNDGGGDYDDDDEYQYDQQQQQQQQQPRQQQQRQQREPLVIGYEYDEDGNEYEVYADDDDANADAGDNGGDFDGGDGAVDGDEQQFQQPEYDDYDDDAEYRQQQQRRQQQRQTTTAKKTRKSQAQRPAFGARPRTEVAAPQGATSSVLMRRQQAADGMTRKPALPSRAELAQHQRQHPTSVDLAEQGRSEASANFISRNALSVIRRQAGSGGGAGAVGGGGGVKRAGSGRRSRAQQQQHERRQQSPQKQQQQRQQRGKGADGPAAVQYVRKQDYGRVPAYLQQRKAEMAAATAAQKEARRRARMPQGMVQMSEEERQATLATLESNKLKYETALSRQPLVIETHSQRRRQQELQDKVAEIEAALKVFGRKVVYVRE